MMMPLKISVHFYFFWNPQIRILKPALQLFALIYLPVGAIIGKLDPGAYDYSGLILWGMIFYGGGLPTYVESSID
jgi:hypothetical protein